MDEETFPADEKLADEEIIGSGPYKLSQYKAGDQAVLEINEEYTGENTGQADQVFVKYYSEPSALKLAAENGEVDVAWRSLSPTDIADLKTNDDVTVADRRGLPRSATGSGTSTGRGRQAGCRSGRPPPRCIDREAIADNAYDGTVDPLYSIVPPGYAGSDDAFKDKYGEPERRRGSEESSRTPASRRRSS